MPIRIHRLLAASCLSWSVISLAACVTDSAAPVSVEQHPVALGVSTSEIAVTSTAPDSASQDTTLDVTINGSGFAAGATASWAFQGVQDPSQIRTNSTRYVTSRKLVANITISSTATLGKWDVVVMSGKKGGIGTEMFAVKQKLLSGGCGGQTQYTDSRASVTWEDLATLGSTTGITSDGLGSYVGGSQSVKATLPYHDASCARSGDLIFDPDSENGSPARKLRLYFPANNDAGVPSGGISSGPYIDFPALMQLGSDVTWDPSFPTGRDANIYEKYGTILRTVEYPALSGEWPDYPVTQQPVTPIFQIIGAPGCSRLVYERIRITRTAGAEGFEQLVGMRASDGAPLGKWSPSSRTGTWLIESVDTGTPAGHAAQCWISSRNKWVANGSPMNMPFKVVVSEVP